MTLQEYENEKKKFDAYIESIKPDISKYPSTFEGAIKYEAAYRAWEMTRSCDAPNKPGYDRANND